MALIDDRMAPRNARRLIVLPGEARVDGNALRHVGGAVPLVKRQIFTGIIVAVAIYRVVPHKGAAESLGIWIYQQLVGIESVPFFRRIGSVNPIAVELSGTQTRQVSVPYLVRLLR